MKLPRERNVYRGSWFKSLGAWPVEGETMKRRAWIVLLALLLIPAVPGLADAKNGHGRGHGYKGGRGHGGYAYYGGKGHGGGYKRKGYYGGRRYGYYGGYYGSRFSFYAGPWWPSRWLYPAYASPYYYPYRYGYPPQVIVAETPVYVERPRSAVPPPAPPEVAYWHYCESLGSYYPDVANCPEGWVKVPPRPE